MLQFSLYDEAESAIQEYKWLESEKAGRDLGDEAVEVWTKSHWLRFYRLRFVWHLQGNVSFDEFGSECFGLAAQWVSTEYEGLLNSVLDKVREGAENLDVIRWARQERLPMDRVVEILKALDINSRRLPPPIPE